jgi:hypothetical protein
LIKRKSADAANKDMYIQIFFIASTEESPEGIYKNVQ